MSDVAAPAPHPVANRASVAADRNRRSLSIDRKRIKERDAARRDFEVRLLEGESLEDVLRPEFLGHAADRLNAGDRVAVLAHDLAWWGEVLVCETDEAIFSVKTVVLLGPVALADKIAKVAPPDLSKAVVEQVADTWRLRHGSKVLSAGFKTRADAVAYLEEIRRGRKVAKPG